jgi:hypothetical protein
VGPFPESQVPRAAPLVTGPVPATAMNRVAAVKAELVTHGIGGAAAQGRSLTPDAGYPHAAAAVEHFLPDAGERRALCRQLADDLRSMIVVGAVEVAEVEDVLGVTDRRLGENGVPRRQWAACRALTDDAMGLVHDLAVGAGEYLDRWRGDDDYVTRALAVLFVVFTRLAV